MTEKKNFYQAVEEICKMDLRYKPDAYEFVIQALHFTQDKMKRPRHVSGRQLLQGIREFVVGQYGTMAKTVLAHWGISKTEDFGNIVFNMIGKGLLSKTEEDSLNDFKDVFNLEVVFAEENVLDNVMKESGF